MTGGRTVRWVWTALVAEALVLGVFVACYGALAVRTSQLAAQTQALERAQQAEWAHERRLRRRLGAQLPRANNSNWPVGMRERVRGLWHSQKQQQARLDREDEAWTTCPAYTIEGAAPGTLPAQRAVGHGLEFSDVALAVPLSAASVETDPRVRAWLRFVGEFVGPENVFLMTARHVVRRQGSAQRDEYDFPVDSGGAWVVDGVAYRRLLLPSFVREEPQYVRENRFRALWHKMKRFWVYAAEPRSALAARTWVAKVDPDTLPVLPYFVPTLGCWNASRAVLFGPSIGPPRPPYVGGACLAVTPPARAQAGDAVLTSQRAFPAVPIAEDIHISQLLWHRALIAHPGPLASRDTPRAWWPAGRTADDVCITFHHLDAVQLAALASLGYTLL